MCACMCASWMHVRTQLKLNKITFHIQNCPGILSVQVCYSEPFD